MSHDRWCAARRGRPAVPCWAGFLYICTLYSTQVIEKVGHGGPFRGIQSRASLNEVASSL